MKMLLLILVRMVFVLLQPSHEGNERAGEHVLMNITLAEESFLHQAL